jgi:uncharacterized protein (UPF0332 family)
MKTKTLDATRFLTLAQEQGQSDDEAKLRTAVSRTYYAAFLVAREAINERVRHSAHSRVIQAVGRQYGKILAGQLDALRRLRTVADYELAPVSSADRNWRLNWTLAHGLARSVLTGIALDD